MDKRIGKIIMMLVLSGASLFATEKVTLQLQDIHFDDLHRVEMSEPFVLQVVAEDVEIPQPDYIPGFENFQVNPAGVSHHTSSINGVTTKQVTFNYILKIDKKGTYSLGPLSVDSNGAKLMSNKLEFTVGDKLQKPDSSKKLPILFHMKTDKKKYYKHEKIWITVQLVFNKKLKNIQFFDAKSKSIYLDRRSMFETNRKELELKGDLFYMKEFLINAYPEEIGKLKINGFETSFVNASDQRNQHLGGLFDFWGAQSLERRMKSDAVWIDVIDLPVDDDYKDVMAIGTFSDFIVEVKKKEVAVGQGVALTVELYGDGNWHYIDTVPLQLPEGLRVYKANSSLVQKEGKIGKKFEFVLQADHDGQYEVDSQKFCYFNPETNEYQTIMSNGFALHVLPREVRDNNSKNDEIDIEKEEPIVGNDEKKQSGIKDYGKILKAPLHRRKQHMIPHYIFIGLLFLLLALLCSLLAYRYIFLIYIAKTAFWRHKQAWYKAYGQIKLAQKHQNFAQLHSAFMGYFMNLNITSVGFIRDYMIVEYLQKHGYSVDQVSDWKKFYDTILQYSFAVDQHAGDSKIFDDALMWIKQMKDLS